MAYLIALALDSEKPLTLKEALEDQLQYNKGAGSKYKVTKSCNWLC